MGKAEDGGVDTNGRAILLRYAGKHITYVEDVQIN